MPTPGRSPRNGTLRVSRRSALLHEAGDDNRLVLVHAHQRVGLAHAQNRHGVAEARRRLPRALSQARADAHVDHAVARDLRRHAQHDAFGNRLRLDRRLQNPARQRIGLRGRLEEHVLRADAHDRRLVVQRVHGRAGHHVHLALRGERIQQAGEVLDVQAHRKRAGGRRRDVLRQRHRVAGAVNHEVPVDAGREFLAQHDLDHLRLNLHLTGRAILHRVEIQLNLIQPIGIVGRLQHAPPSYPC